VSAKVHDCGDNAIAIVGMAGRFPGARNVDEFWLNLRNGVESIRPLSDEALLAAGADASWLRDPNYVKAAGVLDDVALFDAGFFGYSPHEARLIDPQQRVFLECAFAALEDAAHDPARSSARVTVKPAVCAPSIEICSASSGILVQALNTCAAPCRRRDPKYSSSRNSRLRISTE